MKWGTTKFYGITLMKINYLLFRMIRIKGVKIVIKFGRIKIEDKQ